MCIFMILATVLSGCSTVPATEPTATTESAATVTTAPQTTAAATVPTTEPDPNAPLLVKDYLEVGKYDPMFAEYEAVIPENGVLILTGNEAFEEVFIFGDVYITYNADVSFRDVLVYKGNVYCHGILRQSGDNNYKVHAYHEPWNGLHTCSAFDGTHGRIIYGSNTAAASAYISADALDYAFETWGNYGPAIEKREVTVTRNPIEPQVVQHGDTTKMFPNAFIFSGEGLVTDKAFNGDVYITSDAVIEFEDVRVYGNIYCYGQLKITDDELFSNRFNDPFDDNTCHAIYTYCFNKSCDTFDGVHGLVVGGPIYCDKIVVADDALDYAFETFGKQ